MKPPKFWDNVECAKKSLSGPSDGRCPAYRRTMASLAEALVGTD